MSAFTGTRHSAMLAFNPPDLAIEMRLLQRATARPRPSRALAESGHCA